MHGTGKSCTSVYQGVMHRNNRGHRPSRATSAGWLCLCVISFLAGRVTKHSTVPVAVPAAPHNPGLLSQATAVGQDKASAAVQQAALHTRRLALEQYQPVPAADTGIDHVLVQPVQQLSLFPRAYLFPKFLDEERADHVVKLAAARLTPSGLALRSGESMDQNRDVRTSSGTFLSRYEDPDGVLEWIEEKLAVLTGVPSGHGEPFNVLRYELNQHYDSHYDVFDPDGYGPQTSQRAATVLLYLSDVEDGGETIFPLEGRNGLERLKNINYRDCSIGLKYKPRKGDALLFWSLHINGTFDKHALHGGCPVRTGTKWVATKWIRDKCMSNC